MTPVDVSDVTVDDGDYFIQYGSEYVIQEFQKKHINATDNITLTWRGRSTVDTRTSPMLLQIYNANSTIDSYSETNQNATAAVGNTISLIGQSITGNGNIVDRASFYISKTGTPVSNDITVQIWSHNGTFGTNSNPLTLLATSDAINITSITNSLALTTFNFTGANRITLANGTNYVLLLAYSVGAANLNVGYDSTSPTHAGNYYDDNGGATSLFDTCFYLYTNSWETLDRETRIPADTDFEMKATVSTNVANYYDSNNVISARVYQQVV